MIMDDLFKRLERQLKNLLDQHDQLRHAHTQLQQSRHLLSRDKDILLTRQQKAISTIESLLNKLKTIEKGS